MTAPTIFTDMEKDVVDEAETEVMDGDEDGPQNDAQAGKAVEMDAVATINEPGGTKQLTNTAFTTHAPSHTVPTSAPTHIAQTRYGGTRAMKPYPMRTGRNDKQRDLDHQHAPAARHPLSIQRLDLHLHMHRT